MAPRPILTALAGAFALALAMGIGRFAYTPVLPHMVEGAGLSIAAAGYLASLNFLGYFLGALAAASRIVIGPRIWWMAGAIVMSVVTTGAMAATDSFLVWAALRFASGLASAFVLVMTSSIVVDALARSGRPQLSSLLFAGVGSGIALSALLIHFTTGLGDGTPRWIVDWTLLGLLAALLAILPLIVLREGRSPIPTTAPDGEAPPGIVPLIIAYGLFGFGYVINATFIVAMARQGGAMPWLETVIWLVVGLTAAPSVWAWGLVSARFGIERAYLAALLVAAVGAIATTLSTGMTALLIGALLLGATFMGVTALGLAAARRSAPGRERQAVALMTASFAFGQMIGPGIAGWLTEATQSFTAATALASLVLIAAAILAARQPVSRS